MSDMDDGGLAIVRVKPMGAGGGGVEASGVGLADGEGALRFLNASDAGSAGGGGQIRIVGGVGKGRCSDKTYSYMRHVIPPDTDNAALYDVFMPTRVDAFLAGTNVNVIAFGQTGTGKTHTMFGTPGIMGRAGAGEFGTDVFDEYGFFPRGILDIFSRVQAEREAGADLVLTASAVELSIMGNVDMLRQSPPPSFEAQCSGGSHGYSGTQYGVCVDRAAKPARLFGMERMPLESSADVLRVFAALASRCTAGTGLNDSSSRSHCFAFLHLHRREGSGSVVTSRFQFVDLAGNERISQAHGAMESGQAPLATQAGVEGMMTNWSLMMLSTAVRALIQAQKKGRLKSFSFRAYLGDLVPLLSESMTGIARTAVVVCVSQAPENAAVTSNSLDFGSYFAQLRVRPRRVKPESATAMQRAARAQLKEAETAISRGCSKKYIAMRHGQVSDCHSTFDVLRRLGCDAGGGGGEGKSCAGKGGRRECEPST